MAPEELYGSRGVSNSISIPVDSVLYPLIAFSGIISASAMTEMFYTTITLKAIVTLLAFWTICLALRSRFIGRNKLYSMKIWTKNLINPSCTAQKG